MTEKRPCGLQTYFGGVNLAAGCGRVTSWLSLLWSVACASCQPLRRVHQHVLGVLALESEAVAPQVVGVAWALRVRAWTVPDASRSGIVPARTR